jgi:AcrR family transcriptional regulator
VPSPAASEPPRRVGRPRHDDRPVVGDPTDEILAAASRLFGQYGVEGTTMSRIASAVGLKQSSLYYYFRRKEEIVAELVARANVVPLAVMREIVADGGSPAVQLHRFVRADTVALCELPFDINEVHRIAARDTDQFDPYWKERASLERMIGKILRRGAEDGSLRPVDVRLTAVTILSVDESTQNWFRLGSKRKPDVIGTELADLVVAGLLTDRTTLAQVRADASALDADGLADPPTMGQGLGGKGSFPSDFNTPSKRTRPVLDQETTT